MSLYVIWLILFMILLPVSFLTFVPQAVHIFRRSHAELLLEYLVERAVASESRLVCDVADGVFTGLQQFHGLFHTDVTHILVRTDLQECRNLAVKRRVTHAEFIRQIPYRQFLVVYVVAHYLKQLVKELLVEYCKVFGYFCRVVRY